MRLPYVDLREGHAEELPFDDDTFDLALAQLSVHFMADPARGVAEMARVVRPGGTVAAVVWDVHGGGSPLAVFWRAAHAFDPNAMSGSGLPGPEDADLTTDLRAGRPRSRTSPTAVTVHRWFDSFEEWWEPYLLGVGPAGDFVTGLDVEHPRPAGRTVPTTCCPAPPFDVPGKAWVGRAVV